MASFLRPPTAADNFLGSYTPIRDSAEMRALLSERLARNWWLVALRGACSVLFGILALALPIAAILTLAAIFAIYLMLDGVLGLVAAARTAERQPHWRLLILESLVTMFVGGLILAFPGGAVLAFVFLLAAWALLTGGLMLGASFGLHPSHGRLWLGLGGFVSMLWGVLLVIAPLLGAVILTWWIGAYVLVFGSALIVLSVRLHRQRMAIGL